MVTRTIRKSKSSLTTILLSNEKLAVETNEKGVGAVLHFGQFCRDDRLLVEGIRKRNPGAYRAFYHRFRGFVFTILVRTLGQDNDLDELLHDVFFRSFRGLHRLKKVEQLRSWIAVIAMRVASETIKFRNRRRWLEFRAPTELPEFKPSPVEALERSAVETVYSLLDELSEDHRILFTLRYIYGMDASEVADEMGVSIATGKRRLRRARRQFMALAQNRPELKGWIDG